MVETEATIVVDSFTRQERTVRVLIGRVKVWQLFPLYFLYSWHGRVDYKGVETKTPGVRLLRSSSELLLPQQWLIYQNLVGVKTMVVKDVPERTWEVTWSWLEISLSIKEWGPGVSLKYDFTGNRRNGTYFATPSRLTPFLRLVTRASRTVVGVDLPSHGRDYGNTYVYRGLAYSVGDYLVSPPPILFSFVLTVSFLPLFVLPFIVP